MTSNDNNDKGPTVGLLVLLAVFVLGIILLAWHYIPILYPCSEEAGQFGDMFGGVNALFGGLAFAGVIFAILLQKRELQLQRKELEQTREELRGQKNQLEAQNKTFQKQGFENTFFSLLRLHNDLVRAIEIRGISADASAITTGTACFVKFYQSFKQALEIRQRGDSPTKDPLKDIEYVYGTFFGEKKSDLDHYFRSLYHSITYVKNSHIDDKRLYTATVRAQLSSHELLLLFYHCLTPYGKQLKPLVEEFALLKDVALYELSDDALTLDYGPSAFDKG